MESEKKVTPGGLLNLFIVYFVWGSTYLAIRIGIRSGSGFQPFWFGGLRVLAAGGILLLLGLIRGKNIQTREKRSKSVDRFRFPALDWRKWIGSPC